tara:strand:- start:3132 stop:3506 length:375 start_codon:yes stop_codon:yes gene_type:complete
MVDFSILQGMTLARIEPQNDNEELLIVTSEGRVFRQFHDQDCCEHVSIEDICGDLSDLIGSPILQADESCSDAGEPHVSESGTWTFYRLATIKGSVMIRWLGSSNGYYSESVTFEEVMPEAAPC